MNPANEGTSNFVIKATELKRANFPRTTMSLKAIPRAFCCFSGCSGKQDRRTPIVPCPERIQSRTSSVAKVTSGMAEALVEKILLKLPVKSLLRFKSVSPEWYALIESSSFIATHQKHFDFDGLNKNPYLLLSRSRDNPVLWLLGNEATKLRLDTPPFSLENRIVGLVGIGNGLVCLSLHDYHMYQAAIVVWNPATKQYKHLPEVNFLPAIRKLEQVEFAFINETSTGYKVVRISQLGIEDGYVPKNSTYHAQICDQSSNCWRLVKGCLPCETHLMFFDLVILNGVLHWVGTTRANNSLVYSFNLRDEVFRMLSLPDVVNRDGQDIALCSWKETLALFRYASGELWITQPDESAENGTKVSWIKKFSITMHHWTLETKLIGVWKDQFVCSRAVNDLGGNLFLFDPTSQKVENLPIKREGKFFFYPGGVYAESLVQV